MNKLKLTLIGNAIFSGLSGASMLLFGSWLNKLMAIPNPLILQIIGGGLILFSAFLFWTANQSSYNPNQIKMISLMDWGWVAGSLAIILLQAFNLSNTAYWIIGVVALIVATFGSLQLLYLSSLRSG